MKDNAEKSEFSNESSSEGKDRRRFLKQMALGAIIASAVTVLPHRIEAKHSGPCPDGHDPTCRTDDKGNEHCECGKGQEK